MNHSAATFTHVSGELILMVWTTPSSPYWKISQKTGERLNCNGGDEVLTKAVERMMLD
jgi:hypothetical protein